MIELWRNGGIEVTATLEEARLVEAEGWDGQTFMDSQSLSSDPYARMSIWAVATERLKLKTSVTNPLTRHPAVTAAAAATLQSISRGRAVLGIGRGDSSLAYLGYAPADVAVFSRALRNIQTLLSGGEVPFAAFESLVGTRTSDTMVLGQRPTGSRLRWLPRELPKVPLDVAATGPKVIEMAAAIAERVTFSVGASPERVRWALDLARNARKTQGLGAEGPSYGLQIIVVCHPDREAVRAAASSIVAPLARFQVIQGDAAGPVSGCDAEAFAAVQKGYDMTKHDVAIAHDKIKGAALSWDFVQRFAIIGPPDYCTERILQLTALGIEHLKIVGPGYHPEAYENDPGLFVKEVMPAVRAATRPDS